MRVSFIIHTPHYKYTTDKIARHLKCDYAYHTTFEDMDKYNPDVVVAGLDYKQLDNDKFISIYTGHGLSWGSGLYSKSNGWYDYITIISEFLKEEILRLEAPPKKDIWVTGWPTTDNLFTKEVKPSVFDNIKRPVILYSPTSNPCSHLYLNDIHTLIPDGATLMIKPHPVPGPTTHTIQIAEENIKDFTNIIVLDYYENPNDYIPYVDLIISDKSSVLFYPLIFPEKPIIQCKFPNLFELWEWESKKYPQSSSCIERTWKAAWRPITSKEELKIAIVEELANPMRNYQIRKRYGDILFGNLRDGQSGKRIAEKIMQLEKKS